MESISAYLIAQQSQPWPDPVRETLSPPDPTPEAPPETMMGLGIAGFWVLVLIVLVSAFILMPRLVSRHKQAGQPT
jgi:hypothetical protein